MSESTSSREAILARIRSGRPADVAHPEVKVYPVEGDPVDNFIAKLRGADGDALCFRSRADAMDWLRATVNQKKATVFSAIDDFEGNLTAESIADPHDAHIVDICVAEGLLGVGETGSVWVTEKSLKSVAAAIFASDLYLMLDSKKITDGMHDAYRRINLTDDRYGAFFTGPSATADIEAVHITGAQGEISLTVLLY